MTVVRGFCRGPKAGLMLAATLALSACEGAAVDDNRAAAQGNQAAPAPAAPPIPAPAVLGREQLLLAVARAASSAASGMDDAAAQAELDGMRFELALRFGCDLPSAPNPDETEDPAGAAGNESRAPGRTPAPAGPQPAGQPAGSLPALLAAFEERSGTLRVRAAPDVDPDDPLIAATMGPETETVEGFWIPRPWLLSPACPTAPRSSQAESPAPAEPGIAIAQFHGRNESRVAQRADRAYELVRKAEAGTAAARGPFDLVLTGRLRRLPEGKVINCVASSHDRPPRCVVSAELGQVRIAQPGTGETLGEWGGG